ncbi:PocR ligand-binding domain-containing protein [Methanosarcina mazei]|jgi:PAS domain S-box-containing protein|uniref:Sensory transduction histidine kinase n=1 Tax=Methanosarcina mazei LYC TaxID=1434114 RepID=A0A0E3RRE5_METMZ|nr:PocR ligand-binding domain-containing protein [Methanosarcina mazei]AKB68187.1 Sensory transduction histidine kinase [Methanosarcina mazei LYC]
MKTNMEQFPAKNPNPVIRVGKDGRVLYSKGAGELLLHEWGMRVGEKLPPFIIDFVQRVISRNSPEEIEVKVGKRVYIVSFHPLLEEECVNIYGFDINDQKDLNEKVHESESQEIGNVELAEIIDIQTVQSLINDFYELTHIPIGLRDLKDNVLVGAGFQDICSKFHRVHPETCKHCIESIIEQSRDILPGEYKLYKCKNNIWDILTPITVSNQHIGNIIAGQFIFDDEPLDYELFRSQARKYGFNEEEYITALEKVPRLSRKTVNTALSFFMTFASILSQLSYSNNKLAQSLAEREALLEALSVSEEKYRNIVETANEGIALINGEGVITYVNRKMVDMLGYSVEEIVDRTIWDFVEEKRKSTVTTSFERRKQGSKYDSFEFELIRKDGTPLWVLINAKAIFDKDGKFFGALNLHTDITKRKEAEEALRNFETARKKEIHHRIKNNLQVISSLLDLQAEMFKGRNNIRDSEVLNAFAVSMDRVLSIALIHEELYKGENIDVLNFSQYIKELADNLLLTYRLETDVSLNLDLEENLFLDMDTAIPLGIIINELVSNSLKYAFPDRDKGEIRIKLRREEKGECKSNVCKGADFVLIVSDDGIGISENLDIEELDSLGLQLVTSLVDQLDGEFELKRDKGTEFIIKFTVTEKDNSASNPANN